MLPKIDSKGRIVTEAYHLLYLHVVRLPEEETDVPTLNAAYLIKFLQEVSTAQVWGGRKAARDSEIARTKDTLYGSIPAVPKPMSRDQLFQCLAYAAQDMEVAIRNNIVLHFFARQKLFLRAVYLTVGFWREILLNNQPGARRKINVGLWRKVFLHNQPAASRTISP